MNINIVFTVKQKCVKPLFLHYCQNSLSFEVLGVEPRISPSHVLGG